MSAQADPALSRAMDLDVLPDFDVATAALIDARSLQQRIDRKYLLTAGVLEQLLACLRPGYSLLHAGRQMWARYESIYLDTPERQLYHHHRCGRRPRYKIRIRHHVDRQVTCLEIKSKNNSGRTMKRRIVLPYGQNHLGSHERHFIESITAIDSVRLMPCVSTSFRRLTLVGRDVNERLTFDRDVTFRAGARAERLARVVIAEVKQAAYSNHRGAVAALRGLHAREAAFSKYCVGTILVTAVPGNLFKPTLKAVERLSA